MKLKFFQILNQIPSLYHAVVYLAKQVHALRKRQEAIEDALQDILEFHENAKKEHKQAEFLMSEVTKIEDAAEMSREEKERRRDTLMGVRLSLVNSPAVGREIITKRQSLAKIDRELALLEDR